MVDSYVDTEPFTPPPDLTVVVPAFNEENVIDTTLTDLHNQLPQVMPGVNYEIFVVDDGSTDLTAHQAAEHIGLNGRILEHPDRLNRGKGAAMRLGILAAQGARVVVTDADGAYQASEIGKLWQAFEQRQATPNLPELLIATGERSRGDHASRLRQIASWVNRVGCGLIAPTIFIDQQCGLKMYRTDVAQALLRRTITDGYGLDQEIGLLARLDGLDPQTVSVPVKVTETTRPSHVNPLKEAFRLPCQALAMRWHHSRLGQMRRSVRSIGLLTSAQEPEY